MLALRFRPATLDDLAFFGKTTSTARDIIIPKATEASDINLTNIQEKKLLQSYEKREGTNIIKVRLHAHTCVCHGYKQVGVSYNDKMTQTSKCVCVIVPCSTVSGSEFSRDDDMDDTTTSVRRSTQAFEKMGRGRKW
jgi:hypothetical protein